MNTPPAPAAPVRVVKVGGSLLEFELLPAALQRQLEVLPPVRTVLLAGGGELCDVIRRHDRRHGLGQQVSHALCVQLLDVTAVMLSRLLPGAPVVVDWEELGARLAKAGAQMVFAPAAFLRDWEPNLPGRPLSHDWSTTTDSIAARLAEVLDAELVLLKSAPPPPGTLAELSHAGYVDGSFPCAAAPLSRVTLVNLRNPEPSTSIREFRPSRGC